jgi:4,5-dihydroxyphthalate decarboxylase
VRGKAVSLPLRHSSRRRKPARPNAARMDDTRQPNGSQHRCVVAVSAERKPFWGHRGMQIGTNDRLVLKIALGTHEHVRPLREGLVTSRKVGFEFIDLNPLPRAFRLMVRSDDIDVSEMAVVTQLLAHHFGRPVTALAFPLWSRLPHTNLVCADAADIRKPADLEHKTSGVRAYAQTSGVWVRGVLESDYGVDLDTIRWLTMEDAHLPEYRDPPNTIRNTSNSSLRDLMFAGELASIMGERIVDPSSVRTVIPDAEKAATTWIRKTGIFPINHILSVKRQLLVDHPWLPHELKSMFEQSAKLSMAPGQLDSSVEYSLEPNRQSLDRLLDFSARQGITPRKYAVDELFYKI